ncbi:hypothetical protein [Lactobacillus xylocopicola]|uniref:Uncharacterized protein n=1 Tax=Lactobacillus xylocopicola TaxID=2976676 RepID=A0ABN6SPV8_9LACO|nr:hypothetical protein [Lactobacillus xylocopicola]BDR61142.1 hypothetical protein KIM322_14030 [Lactobacillus xylocopicola]
MPKDNIYTILEYCRDHNFYVTIEASEDDYIENGKIIAVDSDQITIDQKEYGKDHRWTEESSEPQLEIDTIQTLDIVNRENYLYQQYVKQKLLTD